VHDINARLMLGEKIDIVQHTQAVSSLVRVAAKVGLDRVARDALDGFDDLNDPALQAYREALNGDSTED
jgi:hypothetical protein